MRKYPIFIVFAIIVVTMCFTTASCSNKKPVSDSTAIDSTKTDTTAEDTMENIIAETPMPKAADELFDDFIFNFAANTKLQFKRIKFPLTVNNSNKASQITQSQWKMEHFFMRQGYYTLIFDNEKQLDLLKSTAISHVVVEKIYLKNKTVQQFVFDRINGEWMMTAVNNNAMYHNTNASFLQFYQRFSEDNAFQVQSMNSSVTFTSPNPDDDFSSQTGTILPEQWPSFKPALIPKNVIYNIIYGQTYSESKQKIFIIRGIANGMEEKLVFRNIKGKWKLVKFYS